MRASTRWLPLFAVVVTACAPQPPLPDAAPPPPAVAPARSDVDRAVERHRQFARQQLAAGNLAAAAAEWQILTLLAPDNAEFRRELDATRAAARRGAQEKLDAARAAQRSGQTERAIQLHVQALALDPASAEAARALRELDRQKYARIQQDRAARAKPDAVAAGAPATARSASADAAGDGYDVEQALEMLAAGDLAGGLRDLRAWVAANPRQRATRLRIGAAVFDKGREQEASGAREQALSTYESAVALRGDAPPEWAARIAPLKKSVAEELYEAGVRASRSDLKRAIAQWEACLRLDPQHARASARLQEARRLQARVQRIEDGTAPK